MTRTIGTINVRAESATLDRERCSSDAAAPVVTDEVDNCFHQGGAGVTHPSNR